MRLDAKAHARLAAAAAAFAGPAHVGALARARDQVWADLDDPLSAISVLRALPGGQGDAPDRALTAAGAWLERRLLVEPGLDAEALGSELAWLVALARAAALNPEAQPEDGPDAFGEDLSALRKARDEALVAKAARASVAAEAAPSPVTDPATPEAEAQPPADEPLLGFAISGLDLGGPSLAAPPPPEPSLPAAPEPEPAPDPERLPRNALVSWPPEGGQGREALKSAMADALFDEDG